MSEADRARGLELMCDWCGMTRWKCLTDWAAECCKTCDHPPTPRTHPNTMIGKGNA